MMITLLVVGFAALSIGVALLAWHYLTASLQLYCPVCGEYSTALGVRQRTPFPTGTIEIEVCAECKSSARLPSDNAVIGTRWCNWRHAHKGDRFIGYIFGPVQSPVKHGFLRSHGFCNECQAAELANLVELNGGPPKRKPLLFAPKPEPSDPNDFTP